MRINIFDNIPAMQNASMSTLGINSLSVQGVYIPGSISFNKLGMIWAHDQDNGSVTVKLGLYSINGASLSLANSASFTGGTQATSWRTGVTSATQDITPGNWYLAWIHSTGGTNASFAVGKRAAGLSNQAHGGFPVRAILSVSTTALPTAIATSDLVKEGGATLFAIPYIIIGA